MAARPVRHRLSPRFYTDGAGSGGGARRGVDVGWREFIALPEMARLRLTLSWLTTPRRVRSHVKNPTEPRAQAWRVPHISIAEGVAY